MRAKINVTENPIYPIDWILQHEQKELSIIVINLFFIIKHRVHIRPVRLKCETALKSFAKNCLFFTYFLSACCNLAFAGKEKDYANIRELFSTSNHKFLSEFHSCNSSEIKREEVYEIYRLSYKDIGLLYPDSETLFSKCSFIAIAKDRDHKVIAFASMRDSPFGLKMNALGTNGSQWGKAFAVRAFDLINTTPGIYVEASGRFAEIYFKYHTATVHIERARKILSNKKISIPTQEELENQSMTRKIPRDSAWVINNAYKRFIILDGKKTPVIKIMVGNPVEYGEGNGIEPIAKL